MELNSFRISLIRIVYGSGKRMIVCLALIRPSTVQADSS
jgi:hypothetical protein